LKNENAKVKKRPVGLFIWIAAAVAIVVIGAIVAWIVYSSSMSYVAKVDNIKITKQYYQVNTKDNMNSFLSSIANTTTTPDKYDWNTKINDETVKEQVKKDTLNQIQEIKIVAVKAKEAGIKIETQDIKDIDGAIIKKYGSKAVAEETIKSAYGVSLSDYKEVYKDYVLTQKYVMSERNKITVTDDEIKKSYDDYKKEFDKVTVTHILIATADAKGTPFTAGKKSEAKKKAEELLAKVKAGEDIQALAVANSDDKPGVTTNKGEYTFPKGQMAPEFEAWAFASHAIGDAEIVETSFGYHVMKFQKREETKFDDVKESIKTSLVSSKFGADFTKKMDAWKKEPQFVVVKNDSVLAKIDKSLYGE